MRSQMTALILALLTAIIYAVTAKSANIREREYQQQGQEKDKVGSRHKVYKHTKQIPTTRPEAIVMKGNNGAGKWVGQTNKN